MTVDAQLLKTVGEIAGIGGLAIGALILVFRDIIRKKIFPQLPPQEAYRLLRLIVVAAWSISALGIATWAYVKTSSASNVNVDTNRSPCSPTIVGHEGDIKLSCDLSPNELRLNAEENLENCLSEIRILSVAQSAYLLPAMNDFIANPTENTWSVAKLHVERTKKRLEAAIDSAIDYDASLEGRLGPVLTSLHKTLGARAQMLAQLPNDPPGKEFVLAWAEQYRQLLNRLKVEIEALQRLVKDDGKTSRANG